MNFLCEKFYFKALRFGGGITVAGDGEYIKRFLIRYVESLNENLDLQVDFIVCYVRPEGSVDASVDCVLDFARGIYSRGDLFVDYINCPDYEDVRSYYSCVRFLQAEKHLAVRSFLLITDLDYQLSKPEFSLFLDRVRPYSLALNEKLDIVQSLFPWLKYTAGTVYLTNDSAGHHFLALFKESFRFVYNHNCFNWGIDQNIIFSVIECLKRRGILIGNIKKIGEPFSVPYDIKKR
ncbi:hypothetical protein ACBP82_12785 [Paenalcaligenes hominis]|uniref:hypothetical protein n=1 Tax=Paenalcaligenes hominis TaxID=643674 RepID=UPI003523E6D9